MSRYIILIILFTSILQGIKAQLFQEDYNNRHDTVLNEGDIVLDLQGATWFYNNEYFNPVFKGYTLIGANFQPSLVYQTNSKLRFTAGAHLQRFYGNDLKTTMHPLFSLEYSPTSSFSVTMGSFNGGENHGMNEVLFSFENHLIDLNENGILINYINSRIVSETWLSWESYIFPGDTVQEQFTAGSSNRINLLKNQEWSISLPVNLLAHHAGGQINNSAKRVETLINISEGLKISRILNPDKPANIFAEFTMFHSSGDFNPSPGRGLSAKAGVETKLFEINGGYFKATDFISFAGNPLYRSMEVTSNPAIPYQYGGSYEMLNFKAGFRQKTGKYSFLFLRFEGYYFTNSRNLDYSYSLHFQVQDFIRLLSVNP